MEGTTSELNVERGDYFQAGQYGFFAMKNPKGRWLFCDGREISRADYPELFEAIGTTYGEGDGTTTFNIPDRRGYFGLNTDFDASRVVPTAPENVVKNIAEYVCIRY